jgi:hypothetical protein
MSAPARRNGLPPCAQRLPPGPRHAGNAVTVGKNTPIMGSVLLKIIEQHVHESITFDVVPGAIVQSMAAQQRNDAAKQIQQN